MKFTSTTFREWKNKRVTLLGMSGVGKTCLSSMLRSHDWFHYSADYRIGTRYLNEAILDLVKQQAMQVPFLRDLLRRDWIDIKNNIRIDNLGPVLAFVGKLGDPALGGLVLDEFSRRQAMYHEAEVAAMYDVASFIRKAGEVYGYNHFINDVGGSLCELDSPPVLDLLAAHSLILYIEVSSAEEEQQLISRAQSDPKPLYYRPAFLAEQVPQYCQEFGLHSINAADPDHFTRWIFPRLFHSRQPRYEAIARQYGYTVQSVEVAQVRDEQDFTALIETAISRAESAR